MQLTVLYPLFLLVPGAILRLLHRFPTRWKNAAWLFTRGKAVSQAVIVLFEQSLES